MPVLLGFFAAWIGLFGLALWLRRRAPESRLLVHATAQLYAVGFSVFSYWLGPHTTSFMGPVLLSGVAVGCLLFDRTAVLLGIASLTVIILGTTLAEQARLIPYAPAFVAAPFSGGHLSSSWIRGFAGANLVTFFVALGVIWWVCYRLRDHEVELERTGEQLARATETISRYVAAQVAEQILAGNYAAVEVHARRRLTLFFSDVKGFTEIAERMEPEDLSRMLNEYLSEMTAIAERQGATIDKFVGDAVMIFFGAPVPMDDHEQARRAVEMAIEMQAQLEEVRARWIREGIEEPFQVRMGINTGVASVGNFGSRGRMDYTAIGRQVNLAARLEASCAPGKILLSHATWVLVRDEIPCVPKGEIEVKGTAHPVKVYEVAAAVRARGGLTAARDTA